MARHRTGPSIGVIVYLSLAFTMGSYFAIAGVQGDYGLFRRIQIDAEAVSLDRQKALLDAEVALLRNRTHRLSDEFLDLDLVDEQVRDVLGYVRADEIVIN